MIQPHQLAIGRTFLMNGQSKRITISLGVDYFYHRLDILSGCPLTLYHITELGFEKGSSDNLYHNGKVNLVVSKQGAPALVYHQNGALLKTIKYLHELQEVCDFFI